MTRLNNFLAFIISNQLGRYLFLVGCLLGLFWLIRFVVLSYFRHLELIKPLFELRIFGRIKELPIVFYLLLATYIQTFLPEIAGNAVGDEYRLIILIACLVFLSRVIASFCLWILYSIFKKDDSMEATQKSQQQFIRLIVNVVFWTMIFILFFQFIGIPASSIVATVGASAVFLAFSIQSLLTDIVASFSIFTDKPFLIGDEIKVGEFSGYVTRIGLKSTRLRTLEGEELIIPNKDLAQSKIQNFDKLIGRRMVQNLTLSSKTTQTQTKKIISCIKKYLDEHSEVDLIRCHYMGLNYREKVGVSIETSFKVKSNDYDVALKIQEDLNYQILNYISTSKLELA